MAYNFLPSGRDQAYLLPPDLRDWLPPEHPVWFVLDVVGQRASLIRRHARSSVVSLPRYSSSSDLFRPNGSGRISSMDKCTVGGSRTTAALIEKGPSQADLHALTHRGTVLRQLVCGQRPHLSWGRCLVRTNASPRPTQGRSDRRKARRWARPNGRSSHHRGDNGCSPMVE
jgi:hypothetical protein